MRPSTIITLAALGMAATSVALGMIYKDWRNREAAWIEIQARKLDDEGVEAGKILEKREDARLFAIALGSGTAGATLLGAAACGLLLRARMFGGQSAVAGESPGGG